jgi:hypothetical protein
MSCQKIFYCTTAGLIPKVNGCVRKNYIRGTFKFITKERTCVIHLNEPGKLKTFMFELYKRKFMICLTVHVSIPKCEKVKRGYEELTLGSLECIEYTMINVNGETLN